jgi:UDP-N-acetylglucosamine--N-acetylmuramyl-(pentapeptide) pyrophosphoryl-undecaprenol N-acetylglucosamine transferase
MQTVKESRQRLVVVAGGTGGHINAAIAIGEEAKRQNFDVHYFSGNRYLDHQLLRKYHAYHINVLGLRYKNPFKIIKSVLLNLIGFIKLLFVIKKIKPHVVIGTGGYVCGSVLVAGRFFTNNIYILEQNSFLGLTNRILQRIAKKIFINFKQTRYISQEMQSKVLHVGNPIRDMNQIDTKTAIEKADVNILVFGGSLGARQVNEFVQVLVKKIPSSWGKIKIIHQVGKGAQFELNIPNHIIYQQFEYLDPMTSYYQWADLIVARAGASSLSEFEVVEAPCYLIPFEAATDNHQELNAKIFQSEVNFPVAIFDRKASFERNVEELIQFYQNNKKYSKPISFKPNNSSNKILEIVKREM